DGIRDFHVTGVQTCALPICAALGAVVFTASFAAFAVLPHVVAGAVALAAVLATAVVYTTAELIHSAPAQSLSVQAAPEHLRGRYLAVYQLSWSVAQIGRAHF